MHDPLMLNVFYIIEVGAVTGGLVTGIKDKVSARLSASHLLCIIKTQNKAWIFFNNFKDFLVILSFPL